MVKIQTVGEEQYLGPGVYAVLLEVPDHFLAPFVGVTAVMPDAGIVVDHGPVKVVKEQVRGDGVGQGGAVVAPVLIVPVGHGVVVGVGQRDGVDALVHLHELVGIGADGGQVVFPGQVHIGGTGAVLRFGGQAADHLVLPLPGKPPAAAELRKGEGILAGIEILDLLLQPRSRRGLQSGVIIVQAEIDLVDDFQQIDFKLHGGEHGALHRQQQLSAVRKTGVDILPDGMPQPKELHIVALDEADGAQIVQLVLVKAKRAQIVDLVVDLLQHLRSKDNVFIAALEIVFSVQVRVLVENHLVHIELIQIGVQQGGDNGFQLHSNTSFVRPDAM